MGSRTESENDYYYFEHRSGLVRMIEIFVSRLTGGIYFKEKCPPFTEWSHSNIHELSLFLNCDYRSIKEQIREDPEMNINECIFLGININNDQVKIKKLKIMPKISDDDKYIAIQRFLHCVMIMIDSKFDISKVSICDFQFLWDYLGI